MAYMNVTLRLRSDPVYKQVQTKKGVTNILDISGADVTERNTAESPWYRVTLWGKYADTMSNYLQKGTIVVVSGCLTTRAYQSKTSGTLLVEKGITDAELVIVSGGKHKPQATVPVAPQATAPVAPQPAPATNASGFQPLTAEEIKELPY